MAKNTHRPQGLTGGRSPKCVKVHTPTFYRKTRAAATLEAKREADKDQVP